MIFFNKVCEMIFKSKKKLGISQEVFESIIGPTIQVQGNLLINQGIRIDGRVNGSILQQDGQDAVVAISESAVITGDVKANSIIISGHLKGNIISDVRLEILKTACIDGNVNYHSIGIEMGATINGNLHQIDEEQLTQDVITRLKQKA
jgi:cytoskeletal protein CcmA (bactofilin family)